MLSARRQAAVLLAGSLLLYGNTIANRYSIDDELVTRGHHATSRGLEALPEIFTSPHVDFAGQRFDYRPVVLATFAFEHALLGENPHVGHFVNVVLYGATAVVLLAFLRSALGAGSTYLAFLAAVFFVVHPIHTEVVASLKSRDEMLALLFGLLSAWCCLRFVRERRFVDAVVAMTTLMLALMSKPSAVPFVALIPLTVAFAEPACRRQSLALAGLLAASLFAYDRVVHTFVPTSVPVPTFVENPLVAATDWTVRLATALACVRFYVEKLLVPYPLRFYYGFDTIPLLGVYSFDAALGAVMFAAIAALVVRGVRARDAAAFGAAWFIVAILPYSNLFVLTKGIVAERSAYLASVGFSVMAAAAIVRLAGLSAGDARGEKHTARRRLAAACALSIVVVFGAMTWDRNRDWKDSFTLYEADLPRLERSVMAHQIYSRQLRREHAGEPPSPERERRLRHAIALSERALAILPSYAAAHEHIGAIYLYDLGEAEAALRHLLQASDLEPRYTLAHYDALYCAVTIGRFDVARIVGQRLMQEDPDHVMGLFYLSKLYFQAGEIERAFAANARLVRLAPERDLAYLNYGYFYYAQTDVDRAVENFEKALAIAPRNAAVVKDLVAILNERGDVEKARRYALLGETLDTTAGR